MDANLFEQIPVTASALQPGHLPVIDGQIRQLVGAARMDTVVLRLDRGRAPRVHVVGLDELVPCVRRDDWAAAGGGR